MAPELLAVILTAVATVSTQLAAMRMDRRGERIKELTEDLAKAEREVARLQDALDKSEAETDSWQARYYESLTKRSSE